MHPALRKGPLFTKKHTPHFPLFYTKNTPHFPLFYKNTPHFPLFFTKKHPPFHFLPTGLNTQCLRPYI